MKKIILIASAAILTLMFSIILMFHKFNLGSVDHTSKQARKIQIKQGLLLGLKEKSGVYSFKGVPYAAPPVDDLRWKEPYPAIPWEGEKKAFEFGSRCVQFDHYADLMFRSKEMSEDCLFVNIWTPADTSRLHPVLVYFHGGGFVAGSGSEPRYDGESMAKRGITVVTVNYRLGLFGFLNHATLTEESPHNSSGNYALLDQIFALRWVQNNIQSFGGDPKQVTIGGESAGSVAVSLLTASPLSEGLFQRAIGESGALIKNLPELDICENKAKQMLNSVKLKSIEAMRKMSVKDILQMEKTISYINKPCFISIDRFFLPEQPEKIYLQKKQQKVDLLAGWNEGEFTGFHLFGVTGVPKIENFKNSIKNIYKKKYKEILKLYQVKTEDDVVKMARKLVTDQKFAFPTWKWLNLHSQKSSVKTYQYLFDHITPPDSRWTRLEKFARFPAAQHSREIEYALGNLETRKEYVFWSQSDFTVSKIMQKYFENFIKTGNPNNNTLPYWSPILPNKDHPVMVIREDPKLFIGINDEKYRTIEEIGGFK